MLELNTIYNIDCRIGMSELQADTVGVCVTSPPYYNAREYSQWETLEDYLNDMEEVFKEVFRVLKNHHVLVLNVGDIIGQAGKAKWSTKKIPLGAYFTVMLEKIGFEFVDDYIWDKGEPQSKRHLGNPPYPFYQYPVNCYEHIMIFHKHVLDKNKIPCPICNETIVVSNSQTEIGVQSWECKNTNCSQKSEHGRGKRFSARSIMMNNCQKQENHIDEETIKKWRRDIIKINPVVKINSKGENTIGHSAPFPSEIPEMAIKFFSEVGDIVLEPFVGSGTSCIEAIKLHRNYIGFELDDTYYENAKERIEKGLKDISN